MSDVVLGPPRAHAPRRSSAVTDPAPRRLIALAVVAAFTLQLGLRGGVSNAVVVAGIGLVVVLLLLDGRTGRREARLLAAAALVPAAFLGVWQSPWLAASNLGAVAILLGAGVLYSRSGSVFDATPGHVVERGLVALESGLGGLLIVRVLAPRMTAGTRNRLARAGLALLITLPMLGLLVALLASADAVFASFLTPDVDAGPVGGHVVLTLVLAPALLVLGAAASAPATDRPRGGGFGVVEVATMLAMAAVVLGLFVVSQLVALTDAGERLVTSAGLTPAEYARSGFFQLCWAAGLLLGFLALVRALAAPETLDRPLVRALGALVPALALGLVVVSLRRMALYDEAFGLTMLRLWVVGAAVWMALVLAMTVVRNASSRSGPNWLVAGAGAAAVALVLVADVVGAEGFVARHNIERSRHGADLDIGYLDHLSDDAVPAIAAAIDDPDAVRDPARARLQWALDCHDERQGAAALNVAAARAADARRAACTSAPGDLGGPVSD
jgi:hypothetical protein